MALSVFYTAHTLREIPSNVMLAKFGARLWIARIMITWGWPRVDAGAKSNAA